MHQSERVTSTTSGHEAPEGQDTDSRDHTGEEDSDTDSWPEDSTSPNDSKYYVDKVDKVKIYVSISCLDFYSESEYDDMEASSTTTSLAPSTAGRGAEGAGQRAGCSCRCCLLHVTLMRYLDTAGRVAATPPLAVPCAARGAGPAPPTPTPTPAQRHQASPSDTPGRYSPTTGAYLQISTPIFIYYLQH